MRPAKLFMCLPDFSGGGAEKVMLTLMRRFGSGHNISCVVLRADGPLKNQLPQKCTLENLNCAPARKAIPELAALFRRKKPEIVCSTLAYFNLTVMMALLISGHRPRRVILREANSPASTLMSLPAQWIGRLGYRYLYNRADAVICNAEHVHRDLVQLGVKPERISVIPNPVDAERLHRLAKNNLTMPAFSKPALPLLVAAGRLTRQKGMDRLISWAGAMKTKANLLIMGTGPDYDALKDQIIKNKLEGRVKIICFQENPFPFIVKADGVLMGSRWEGLPNIALEALALGKTVIATKDCGGLVDLKNKIQDNTLIIADTDTAFISALDQLSKDRSLPKTKEGSLPGSSLPDSFHIHNVVRQYHSVIFGS